MKQYNDCSAVGSALHFKGCQVLDKLFHASVTAKRFLHMQAKSVTIYWQLLYHGLHLNYTNSVMFSQFMNGTQLYRHGVCIFNIAVHWCKELA